MQAECQWEKIPPRHTKGVEILTKPLSGATLIALVLASWGAVTPLAGQVNRDHSPRTAASSSARNHSGTPQPSCSKLLDINVASKDELKALPGIGDVMAQKIIEGRPYRSKRDLLTRKILPVSAYKPISDKIVARQPRGNPTSSLKYQLSSPAQLQALTSAISCRSLDSASKLAETRCTRSSTLSITDC
jgi:competence protein ComEA